MPGQPMEALHFQGNSQRSFRQRMDNVLFYSSLVHRLHFQVLIFYVSISIFLVPPRGKNMYCHFTRKSHFQPILKKGYSCNGSTLKGKEWCLSIYECCASLSGVTKANLFKEGWKYSMAENHWHLETTAPSLSLKQARYVIIHVKYVTRGV